MNEIKKLKEEWLDFKLEQEKKMEDAIFKVDFVTWVDGWAEKISDVENRLNKLENRKSKNNSWDELKEKLNSINEDNPFIITDFTQVDIIGIKNPSVDELARKLHEWYLDAIGILIEKGSSDYNKNAMKPYNKLNPNQRFIDLYIARKLIEFFSIKYELEVGESD